MTAQAENLRSIVVRPGDRVVFRASIPITEGEHEEYAALIRSALGDDIRCVILSPDWDVTVLGAEGGAS